jgi:mono/diheme cytochrome c family protein
MRGDRFGLVALAFSLAACSPSPSATAALPQSPADATDGARLYAGNCIGCHQANGQGIPGVYPNLAGSPVVLGDPAAMASWIVKGRRPTVTPAGRYPTLMPQFAWLKSADVAALLSYLRSSFGNHATAVDPEAITKALKD